jgi:3-oxoacyl-[acyl-carrier protein] reductase
LQISSYSSYYNLKIKVREVTELPSRTVVVTGAGTGIGRAIAAAFAAGGDVVVLLGRRSKVLSDAADEIGREASDRVRWRQCDVSDPAQVDTFVAWLTRDVTETLDVLVNNAGGPGTLQPGSTSAEAARYAYAMLATNLVGAYLMVHAARPLLRRPGGRILNISSVAAFRGGGDMYSAAKAGLVGLTYSLARELAPEGITVNAIAPGLVLGTEFFGAGIPEERRRRIIAETPAAQSGEPVDIAGAVRYLASPEASYVTGEVLHVNGGQVFGR